MTMKIALDAAILPDASPEEGLARVRTWGFDGVVVPGGAGLDEGAWAAALCDPGKLGRTFSAMELTPVALRTGLSLDHPDKSARRGAAQRARQAVDVAVQLGCQRVICAAANPGREPLERTLTRDVETLANVASYAARSRVNILLDNAGTSLHSRELWHLRDAAGCPAVRFGFRPLEALRAGDSLSLAIKQLASGIEIVFAGDGTWTGAEPVQYTRLGGGQANIGLLVELLKGVAFDGWLCVSWPPESGLGEDAIALAVQFLRHELVRPPVVLSAYKGDKHAPRFAKSKPDRSMEGEASEL